MSLTGNLGVFPLEDVLRMLSHSQKSGCLRIEGSGVQGRVFLETGKLTFATVTTDDELRRQLLAAGLVDEAQFRRVELSGAVLTEVLAGDATPAGLAEFVREHVVESMYRIRKPQAGTFDFIIDKAPRYPTGQSLDVDLMLSEADRRAHEWSEIESVLPDGTAFLRMIPELPDENSVTLSPLTWRILAALGSGASTVDIARALGMSAFWTSSEMASLVRNGLVENVVGAGVSQGALAAATVGSPALEAPAVDMEAAVDIEAPAAEVAATEVPAVDIPTAEAPSADIPVAEPPAPEPYGIGVGAALDEPSADEAFADEPSADEPSHDEAFADEPSADAPSTDEPSADDRPWDRVPETTDGPAELQPVEESDPDGETVPADETEPAAADTETPTDAPMAYADTSDAADEVADSAPESTEGRTEEMEVPAPWPPVDESVAGAAEEPAVESAKPAHEAVVDSPWSRLTETPADDASRSPSPWQRSGWEEETPADAETDADAPTADEDQDASWSQWGVIDGDDADAEQPVVAAVEPGPDAETQPAEPAADEGWWNRSTEESRPATSDGTDAEADRFLESVFSSLSDDEEKPEEGGEDETGFGLGLLRRRRMNAAARDIADNDT